MALWHLMRWQARILGPEPLLAALAWLAGLTLVFGTENLPAAESARLLEGFAPVCGLFLFIGVFGPETERGLRDCVAARRAPYLACCALRALWPVLAAAVLAVLCPLALWLRGCAAEPALAFAFFANTLFLGALALFSATVLGGPVAGAMPPLAWLLLDVVCGKLGGLSLLRCTDGIGPPKAAVLAAAVMLLGAAFGAQYTKMRRA